MESLTLLRKWTMEKRTPELDLTANVVRFGSVSLPANTLTAWYSSQKDAFYTIAALVLFVKHADTPQSEYIRATGQARSTFVSTVERKELLAYLKGERDTSKQIQVPFDEGASAPSAVTALPSGPSNTAPLPALVGLSEEQLERAKSKVIEMLNHGGECSPPLKEDSDFLAYIEADRPVVAAIKEKEMQVTDRNSMLRRQNKDFKFALEYYMEVRRKEKEMEREKDDGSYGKKRSRGERDRQHGSSGSGSSSSAPRQAPPSIILVPNAPNAMITLYNVKDFLQEGQFVTSTARKANAERKPADVKLERQLPDGSTTTYIVLDNPSRLSRTEWARVVCVIVQGAAWQFKGWEWEQPVLLFQHVLGVHIKYDDVPMDTRVAGWNVRVLEVNKDKRHLDKGASLEFWRWVDNFLLTSEWHAKKN